MIYELITEGDNISIVSKLDNDSYIYFASTDKDLNLPNIPEHVLEEYKENPKANNLLCMVLTKGQLTIEDDYLVCYIYEKSRINSILYENNNNHYF